MIKPIDSELLKRCMVSVPPPVSRPESSSVSMPEAESEEINPPPYLPEASPAEEDKSSQAEESAEELPVEFTDPALAQQEKMLDAAELRRRIAAFFRPDGPLQYSEQHGGRPYEFRCQQSEMANAVADALLQGYNLCVEAPTGVGKSFAYLAPLILFSKLSGHALVVSTETINLQEQLMYKDLPLLKKLMQTDFKAALAKGRGNYLCLRRLALATGERREEYLPLHSLLLDIDRIYRWSEKTSDGNRDSADFRVENGSWSYVCCETGNCLGPKCRFFRRCFYWKARLEWESADIIVTNHALFFTDLKMQQESPEATGGLLPVYSAVVVDEAHTLENNAAEYLGFRLNQAGLNGFLNRLYNHENARGLLGKSGSAALELREQISQVREASQRFFLLVEDYMTKRVGNDESICRIEATDIVPDLVSGKLARFRDMLSEYIDLQEDADFKSELESQLSRCDSYIDGIVEFLSLAFPESVYWIEKDNRGNFSLSAAPLNVPEILQDILFTRTFPVILTSATLTVGRSFDYFQKRTGFTNGRTLKLDSPFDPDQVTVHVSRSMPEPGQREEYEAMLEEEIKKYVLMTHGKAFVLFTSYSQLRRTADALAGFFQALGVKLLIQGEDLTRSAMLREFKEDVDSVLFGTDSFWTGVDVPGEALSNVIITRLPFSVPSHPLIEARCQRIEKKGGKPFFDYSLPEAVLKFRQGVGRLIRSRTDSGIIVLLDSRVVGKRYGKVFLDSLPDYHCEID